MENPVPVPRSAPSRETVSLALLFGVMYFVQGVGAPSAGLITQPIRSLLRSWGETPTRMALFGAVVTLPWAFKPLYGLLSDFVPLFGQRRRSYLIVASASCVVGFSCLWVLRPGEGSYPLFLSLLVLTTLGIAFSDVVVDGLMIEKGQPLGLTGSLQSVQWAATYGATVLTFLLGGYLSERGLEYEAFVICAAFSVMTLVLAWRIREGKRRAPTPPREAFSELRRAAATPSLVGIALLLFVWNLDPLSTTVVYVAMTERMAFTEQFFGVCLSVFAAGAVVASAAYGLYCRRVSLLALAHLSIALGALSQAAFWAMGGRASALAVHFAVGVTWMTASLIQLHLAAQLCPLVVAGTVFAALMALSNVASSLGEAGGGWLYDHWGGVAVDTSFSGVVLVAVLGKTACWLLFLVLPQRWALRRSLTGDAVTGA